jgi:hypothetical protein
MQSNLSEDLLNEEEREQVDREDLVSFSVKRTHKSVKLHVDCLSIRRNARIKKLNKRKR